MGPFKCPECGVWWAGFEHRCPRVTWADRTTWDPKDATTVPPYEIGTDGTTPWPDDHPVMVWSSDYRTYDCAS